MPAAGDERIRCHHPRASAVAHDGEAGADIRLQARQDLRRIEQLPRGIDSQDPGTAKCRLVHRVRPGEGPAMRQCRARRLSRAPGLHDDHRFVARRGSCRRHELASRPDRLDVHQDRPRLRVPAEVIEQVPEVDVRSVTERDEVRKPDAHRARPIEHRRRQRARLRDERKRSGSRAAVREARIETDPGHQESDAVRTQDPQRIGPGGRQHGAGETFRLARDLLQTGADHNRGPRSARAEFGNQAGMDGAGVHSTARSGVPGSSDTVR